MKATYDSRARALYVYFVDEIAPGEVERTAQDDHGLLWDHDADGRILGVEILLSKPIEHLGGETTGALTIWVTE